MLVACPWRRLPLTVRWLQQEYALEFPLDKQPPVHMPIAYGQVELTSEKKKKKKIHEDKKCSQEIEDDLEQERMDEEDSSHDETSISCCICQQVCILYLLCNIMFIHSGTSLITDSLRHASVLNREFT